MNPRYITACLLLLALTLTGCLRLEQNLILAEDNSGTLKVVYTLPERTISQFKAMTRLRNEMMAAAGETPRTPDEIRRELLFLDPQKKPLQDALAAYADLGVSVTTVDVKIRNAARTVRIELAFDDLARLAEAEFFQRNGFSLLKDPSGHYIVFRPAETAGLRPAPMLSEEEAKRSLLPLLQEFRVSLGITTPGRILKSNATHTGRAEARWVFDFDQDANAFARLQNQEFTLVFDGNGLDLHTFKIPPPPAAAQPEAPAR